jgi:hypothetical protein
MAAILWEPALPAIEGFNQTQEQWLFEPPEFTASRQIPFSQHPCCSHSRHPCALIDCSRQLDCPEHSYPTLPVQA